MLKNVTFCFSFWGTNPRTPAETLPLESTGGSSISRTPWLGPLSKIYGFTFGEPPPL